jgi:hypothetical protein
MNSLPNLTFNEKKYRQHLITFILASWIFPSMLLYHFQKVGIERFLIVSSINFCIWLFIYLRTIHIHYRDALRMNSLPLKEAVVIETYMVGGKQVRYEAAFQIEHGGKTSKFIARKSRRAGPYKKGANTLVLFDVEKPENSPVVSQNFYINQNAK